MPIRLREGMATVLAVDWYPIEISAALHAAIRDVLGGGRWDENQRISIAAAKIEIARPCRMIMRLFSTTRSGIGWSELWPQY